jgi:ABC-type branched-subunit amino acid transport system ATPase component
MLTLTSVSKSFGGVRAVRDVSLSLGDNDMLAVIGPNGCGKTTLFNLITGYLAPDGGEIRFEGERLAGLPLHAIARRGIVRKFQVPSVFLALNVRDNLIAAMTGAGRPADLGTIIAASNLAGLETRPASALSHGQKQWLELAMCLAASPKLLLLDEPAAGMTRAEKQETVRLVHQLRDKLGLAAILIEHDMDFVEALDCPVSVMMQGAVIATGSFDAIKADSRVRDAYFGKSGGGSGDHARAVHA